MNISQYYHDQLGKIKQYRDKLVQTGYNPNLVLSINKLLNEFEISLTEYDTAVYDYQHSPLRENTAFGSNKYDLDNMISHIEECNKVLNDKLVQISNINSEQMQTHSITSIFTPEDATKCINNSRNIFPECKPIDATQVESNLYLIKDKELERYQSIYNNFDKLLLQLYNDLQIRCKTEDLIMELSQVRYIKEQIDNVISLIDVAINDRNYYNQYCMDIVECNPNYAAMERYLNTSYPNIIQKLEEILQKNVSTYDEILNNIN